MTMEPNLAPNPIEPKLIKPKPVVVRLEFATEDLEQLLKLFGRLEP